MQCQLVQDVVCIRKPTQEVEKGDGYDKAVDTLKTHCYVSCYIPTGKNKTPQMKIITTLPHSSLHIAPILRCPASLLGKSFIYRNEWGIACYAGYLIRFRCNVAKLLPDYLYYFTLSSSYWQQIFSGMIQSTIQNFSAERYGNVLVPLPDIGEQIQIVNYIHSVTTQIDKIRLSTQSSIELLEERRSALISAAVTGQIEQEVDL